MLGHFFIFFVLYCALNAIMVFRTSRILFCTGCAAYHMLASVVPLRLIVAPFKNPRLATLLILLASPLSLLFSCVASSPSSRAFSTVSISSRRGRGLVLCLIRLATKSPNSALRLPSELRSRSSSSRAIRLRLRVGEVIQGNLWLEDRVGVRFCEFPVRNCNFTGDRERSLGGDGGGGRDIGGMKRVRGSRRGDSSSPCKFMPLALGVKSEVLSGVWCGKV